VTPTHDEFVESEQLRWLLLGPSPDWTYSQWPGPRSATWRLTLLRHDVVTEVQISGQFDSYRMPCIGQSFQLSLIASVKQPNGMTLRYMDSHRQLADERALLLLRNDAPAVTRLLAAELRALLAKPGGRVLDPDYSLTRSLNHWRYEDETAGRLPVVRYAALAGACRRPGRTGDQISGGPNARFGRS